MPDLVYPNVVLGLTLHFSHVIKCSKYINMVNLISNVLGVTY